MQKGCPMLFEQNKIDNLNHFQLFSIRIIGLTQPTNRTTNLFQTSTCDQHESAKRQYRLARRVQASRHLPFHAQNSRHFQQGITTWSEHVFLSPSTFSVWPVYLKQLIIKSVFAFYAE